MMASVLLSILAITSNALTFRDLSLQEHCKFVYLDIGSNIGVQVRKLFEPAHYKGSKVLPVFARHFGTSRGQSSKKSGICAIGFEANPHHTQRLNKLEEAYQKNGWNVHFVVPRVVSDNDDETIQFHPNSNDKTETAGSITGFTPGSEHGFNPFQSPPASLPVRSMDISAFIQSNVLSSQRKQVIAKMDIEGSEFLVIPKMLKDGLLCAGKIDLMYIEWHPNLIPAAARKKGFNSMIRLKKQIKEAKYCEGAAPTQLLTMDDESYFQDEVPLPH